MKPLHAVVDTIAEQVVAVASLVPIVTPVAAGTPVEGGDLAAGTPRDVADRAAVAAGCVGIGERWTPLDADEARSRLVGHVGHDLAYSNIVLRPAAECEALVGDLLDHVEAGARWFTNATTTRASGSMSWTAVSPAWTFDIAYAAVGETWALFVAFFAED